MSPKASPPKRFWDTSLGIWLYIIGTRLLMGLGGLVAITIVGGLVYLLFWVPEQFTDPAPTRQLVLAGKVVNSQTGEWPNNRLVLVFLNGKEIARSTTAMGSFSRSRQGIHDGLFVVQIDNAYRLARDSFLKGEDGKPFFQRPGLGDLYHWFPEFEEGGLVVIPVPSKNLTYAVKVLTGDVASLPQAILTPGSAQLRGTNNIVISLADASPAQMPPAGSAIDTRVSVQGTSYEKSTQTIETNKVTVPINNCGGSAPVVQQFVQSQTFIHEYRMEAGAGAGVSVSLPVGWAKLVFELQAKYGFEQGQIDTRTVGTTLEAAPGTNQVYVVTWKEVWEAGTANVLVGNDSLVIPFRVRTNLIYSIDSNKLGCN